MEGAPLATRPGERPAKTTSKTKEESCAKEGRYHRPPRRATCGSRDSGGGARRAPERGCGTAEGYTRPTYRLRPADDLHRGLQPSGGLYAPGGVRERRRRDASTGWPGLELARNPSYRRRDGPN